MDLFKKKEKTHKKKYTLRFTKSWLQGDSIFYSRAISNDYILGHLVKLQDKYDFDILSVSLKDIDKVSKIKIRCTKEDKSKIFVEFCIKLDKYICNFSFK